MPAMHVMTECCSCKHSSQEASPTSAHQLEYGSVLQAAWSQGYVKSWATWRDVHIRQKPSKHPLCWNPPLSLLSLVWLFPQAQLGVLLLKANSTELSLNAFCRFTLRVE